MSGQLIYTSCRRGRGTSGSGFQIFSFSDGIDASYRKELASYALYNASEELPTIVESGREEDYPKSFKSIVSSQGNVMVLITYLGTDWSGTRFGSNTLAHILTNVVLDAYAIEYYLSSSFITQISKDEVSSEEEPLALPEINVELNESRPVTFSRVCNFVKERGIENVERLIFSLIYRNESPVSFSAPLNEIPLWIAATLMVFPKHVANRLNFSTNGGEKNLRLDIFGKKSESNSFKLTHELKTEDRHFVEYLKDAYSDEAVRKKFFAFLEDISYGGGISSDIIRAYNLYLLCNNAIGSLNEEEIRDAMLYFKEVCDKSKGSIPAKYSLAVLKTDYATNEEISFIGSRIIDRVSCPEEKCKVNEIVIRHTLAGIKTITARYQIKNVSDYSKIVEKMIDESGADTLDSPAEAYLTIHAWERTKSEKLAKSSLLIQKKIDESGRTQTLLDMLKEDSKKLWEYCSKDYPLSEQNKNKLLSFLLKNPSANMFSIEKIVQDSAENGTDLAKVIFYGMTQQDINLTHLITIYLDRLKYELASPGVNMLLRRIDRVEQDYGKFDWNIAKEMLRYFERNRATLIDENLIRLLCMINEEVNPFVISPDMVLSVLSSVKKSYPKYYTKSCVESNNRILAALVLSQLSKGCDNAVSEGGEWFFEPSKAGQSRYVAEIVGGELKDSVSKPFIEKIVNLFPHDEVTTMIAFRKAVEREIEKKPRPHIIASFVAVAVSRKFTDAELRSVLSPLAKSIYCQKDKERNKLRIQVLGMCNDSEAATAFDKFFGTEASEHGSGARSESKKATKTKKEKKRRFRR